MIPPRQAPQREDLPTECISRCIMPPRDIVPIHTIIDQTRQSAQRDILVANLLMGAGAGLITGIVYHLATQLL